MEKPEVTLAIKPSKAEREETLAHLGGTAPEATTAPDQPQNHSAVSGASTPDTFVGSPLPTGAAANARREAVQEEAERTSRPDVLPK